jgi:hypothetical protein
MPVAATHHVNRQKLIIILKKNGRIFQTTRAQKLKIGLACINKIIKELDYKQLCA